MLLSNQTPRIIRLAAELQESNPFTGLTIQIGSTPPQTWSKLHPRMLYGCDGTHNMDLCLLEKLCQQGLQEVMNHIVSTMFHLGLEDKEW